MPLTIHHIEERFRVLDAIEGKLRVKYEPNAPSIPKGAVLGRSRHRYANYGTTEYLVPKGEDPEYIFATGQDPETRHKPSRSKLPDYAEETKFNLKNRRNIPLKIPQTAQYTTMHTPRSLTPRTPTSSRKTVSSVDVFFQRLLKARQFQKQKRDEAARPATSAAVRERVQSAGTPRAATSVGLAQRGTNAADFGLKTGTDPTPDHVQKNIGVVSRNAWENIETDIAHRTAQLETAKTNNGYFKENDFEELFPPLPTEPEEVKVRGRIKLGESSNDLPTIERITEKSAELQNVQEHVSEAQAMIDSVKADLEGETNPEGRVDSLGKSEYEKEEVRKRVTMAHDEVTDAVDRHARIIKAREFYFLHIRVMHTSALQRWKFDCTISDETDPYYRPAYKLTNLSVNENKHIIFNPPDKTVLDPVEILPWIHEPKDLYTHTIRIQVHSSYPVKMKVVDSTVRYVLPGDIGLRVAERLGAVWPPENAVDPFQLEDFPSSVTFKQPKISELPRDEMTLAAYRRGGRESKGKMAKGIFKNGRKTTTPGLTGRRNGPGGRYPDDEDDVVPGRAKTSVGLAPMDPETAEKKWKSPTKKNLDLQVDVPLADEGYRPHTSRAAGGAHTTPKGDRVVGGARSVTPRGTSSTNFGSEAYNHPLGKSGTAHKNVKGSLSISNAAGNMPQEKYRSEDLKEELNRLKVTLEGKGLKEELPEDQYRAGAMDDIVTENVEELKETLDVLREKMRTDFRQRQVMLEENITSTEMTKHFVSTDSYSGLKEDMGLKPRVDPAMRTAPPPLDSRVIGGRPKLATTVLN